MKARRSRSISSTALTVEQSASIRFTGSLPIVLVARTSIQIFGTILVNGSFTSTTNAPAAGPGGFAGSQPWTGGGRDGQPRQLHRERRRRRFVLRHRGQRRGFVGAHARGGATGPTYGDPTTLSPLVRRLGRRKRRRQSGRRRRRHHRDRRRGIDPRRPARGDPRGRRRRETPNQPRTGTGAAAGAAAASCSRPPASPSTERWRRTEEADRTYINYANVPGARRRCPAPRPPRGPATAVPAARVRRSPAPTAPRETAAHTPAAGAAGAPDASASTR